MDPLSLISGGMGLIGSIFGSNQQSENVEKQIAANKEMVAQQQAFQERMSNTAYQRASSDMQAAGLNPMMMFSSGSAASSPGGASIPAPTINKTSALAEGANAMQKAISTAVQMKTANATIDNLIEENAKIKAQTALTKADENLRSIAWNKVNQEYLTERERTDLVHSTAIDAANKAITAKNETSMDPTARRLLDIGGYGARKVSDIIDPIASGASSALGVKRLFKPSRTTSETTRDDGPSVFTERFHYH